MTPDLDTDAGALQGVVETRRSVPATLLALVRNPLEAIPPEAATAPLVVSRIGGATRLYVTDPGLLTDLLVTHAEVMGKGEDVRRVLGPALGQGFLTADGAHWRWQRRSVAAAFRHERLLALLPAMVGAAERTRDRWLAAGAGTLDLGHEMMRTTFDIIVETMMSGRQAIDVARVERAIGDFLQPTGWQFAISLLNLPDGTPYPGRRRSRAAIAFLRRTIGEAVAARREGGAAREDLVQLLLAAADPETGRAMSDAEITDNLLTFITAGHETTALGLAWTLHLLARHPEAEARLLAEIEGVTGGGPLAPGHVPQLAYARQVFSEAMRLFPPAPMITRTALADVRLGTYPVPAGTVLYVPIFTLHRRPALWPEPERFDPERFRPEAVKARHRLAYMPFGAGPRICIGSTFAMLEGVAILAVLLRAFRFGAAGETPEPLMKVTLRPKRRLAVPATPRAAA